MLKVVQSSRETVLQAAKFPNRQPVLLVNNTSRCDISEGFENLETSDARMQLCERS